MTYRCQGCRDYHHTVYRRLGLGSVCSPECEATVRARQRGGRAATKRSDRDSYFIEPAPGTGDSTGNSQTAPGPGDSAETDAAPGSAGDLAGVPHTGDSAKAASGDTDDPAIAAAPGDTGEFRQKPSAASGNTDDLAKTREEQQHQREGIRDSTILDLHQRDGTHDSTSRSSDHDSKRTLREEALATTNGWGHSGTALSRDWKDQTLERDQRCRYCGTRRNLHVHHVNYKSQGGNNDPHNLIALCVEHHGLVHSDKGLWQPILRAYIWLLYIEGRRLFLLDIKRMQRAST